VHNGPAQKAGPVVRSRSILDDMADFLAAVMILDFLLMLLNLAVEFVDQTVHGSIEIFVN
jgi:hypothetical protein